MTWVIVAVVAVIVLAVVLMMIMRNKKDKEDTKDKKDKENKKDKKENFSYSPYSYDDTFELSNMTDEDADQLGIDVIENFPQQPPMNVMYSDANGNLATTTNVGLENLTVKGESVIGALTAGSSTVNGTLNVSDKLTGPTVTDLYNLINSVKASLEKRVGELDTKNTNLDKRTGDLETKNRTLETRADTLETRASSIETNHKNLTSRVDGHDGTLATCAKIGEDLWYTNVDSPFNFYTSYLKLRRTK